MFLAWGPDLCLLYNDAYLEILADRHPAALGRPFLEVWPEIREEISPLIERAQQGEAGHHQDRPFTIRRQGAEIKCYFTFSYAPVLDENGRVEGLHCSITETTAQVLAKEKRANETERLQDLFQQAPSFIAAVHGPDHVFELVNNAYLQLIGHRDVIGKPVRSALPEVAAQGFVELLDRVYQTGEPFFGRALPITLQRKPGADFEERFVDFVYQPIRNAAGQVTGIFCDGNDVTESVRAQAALRASEERLKQLANNIPPLAWIAHPDGRAYWYNNRFYEYTGQSYEDLEGWGWTRIVDPPQLPEVESTWAACRASGTPAQMTIRLRGSDGHYRRFLTMVAPLRDASGQIVQWFGTNTDISRLEEAESAVRESEERLREGLTAARMVAWQWQLDNGRITVSDNAREILGSRWTHVDEAWAVVHPDDLAILKDHFRQAIEQGAYFDTTARMIRPDNGETLWVEIKGKVKPDASGKPALLQGITLDVSARKRAEEELRNAARQKDEFLAMLAHELRNPLAPISTATELLKLPGLHEEQLHRTAQVIARQVSHMNKLVDDLLDVSRVTRGLVSLSKEVLDLNAVIADALEQIRPLVERKNHLVTVQMPGGPALVEGDRTRLVQVVSNVLHNAAKYTQAGGSLSVRLELEPQCARIRVQDSGIGIPQELLPYLFDLFTQARRSAARSEGGLGLGLALVKSLVELHGGSVWAKSAGPGQGSEVIIELPRVSRPQAEPGDSHEHMGAGPISSAVRVLVVDDNVDAAQTLGLLLEIQGYRVFVEYEAQGALERARTERPHALILDIGLPDMDGYELARQLRATPETAQALLVALSGYGQDRDKERSAAAGFDHHMVKPADLAQLTALIAKIVP